MIFIYKESNVRRHLKGKKKKYPFPIFIRMGFLFLTHLNNACEGA